MDELLTLSKIGLDGVLLSFPRYTDGMREFHDVTYPLVKQAGLRDDRARWRCGALQRFFTSSVARN